MLCLAVPVFMVRSWSFWSISMILYLHWGWFRWFRWFVGWFRWCALNDRTLENGQKMQNNWWQNPAGDTRFQVFLSAGRLHSALVSWGMACTLCYPSFSLSVPLLLFLPGKGLLISPPVFFPKLIPSFNPFAFSFSASSSRKSWSAVVLFDCLQIALLLFSIFILNENSLGQSPPSICVHKGLWGPILE